MSRFAENNIPIGNLPVEKVVAISFRLTMTVMNGAIRVLFAPVQSGMGAAASPYTGFPEDLVPGVWSYDVRDFPDGLARFTISLSPGSPAALVSYIASS